MIKKISFGFLVALVVLFSGCSQKDVDVAEETQTPKEVPNPVVAEQEADEQAMQSETQSEQTNSGDTMGSDATTESSATNDGSATAPKLDNVYFDYNKFAINGDMRDVVKANHKKLEDSKYDRTITLQGHCDERGSNEYNFALGLKRAQAVKSELVEYGVNPSQIKVMSYGENQPLCVKHTKDCWSKNRRVEALLD